MLSMPARDYGGVSHHERAGPPDNIDPNATMNVLVRQVINARIAVVNVLVRPP